MAGGALVRGKLVGALAASMQPDIPGGTSGGSAHVFRSGSIANRLVVLLLPAPTPAILLEPCYYLSHVEQRFQQQLCPIWSDGDRVGRCLGHCNGHLRFLFFILVDRGHTRLRGPLIPLHLQKTLFRIALPPPGSWTQSPTSVTVRLGGLEP